MPPRARGRSRCFRVTWAGGVGRRGLFAALVSPTSAPPAVGVGSVADEGIEQIFTAPIPAESWRDPIGAPGLVSPSPIFGVTRVHREPGRRVPVRIVNRSSRLRLAALLATAVGAGAACQVRAADPGPRPLAHQPGPSRPGPISGTTAGAAQRPAGRGGPTQGAAAGDADGRHRRAEAPIAAVRRRDGGSGEAGRREAQPALRLVRRQRAGRPAHQQRVQVPHRRRQLLAEPVPPAQVPLRSHLPLPRPRQHRNPRHRSR